MARRICEWKIALGALVLSLSPACVERALTVPADLAIFDASAVPPADAVLVDLGAHDLANGDRPMDAALDAAPLPDGGCPARMAEVSVPDAGTYCIDATEVSNDDYATFLAAKGNGTSTGGQDAVCSWNTSYVPAIGWPVVGKGAYPVVYVDWCDAAAYCRWAGKRLCARVVGGIDEWAVACTSGGKTYPYGNAFSGGACNGFAYGADHTLPVGSLPSCEGGVPGLYDMSGNVWEWVDSCHTIEGNIDICDCRGGGYFNDSAAMTCSYVGIGNRKSQSDGVGIRCCAASH